MKNQSSIKMLFIAFTIGISSIQTQAQSLNKDALAFVKTFQDNYNKGDLAALMTMYSSEIAFTHSDGKVEKVNKSTFEKDYIRDFGESGGTHSDLTIHETKTLADGKIKVDGKFNGYDFDRKTMEKLNPTMGDFEFVIAKEDGNWKFTDVKMVYAISQIWKDIRTNLLTYQDNYNKENTAGIMALYSKNSQRTGADGKTIMGAANIAADFNERFKNEDAALILKLANVRQNFDGSISVTGIYTVSGLAKNGDRIARIGSYSNKAIKEDGKWKYSDVKLGGLIKTVMYHKVADYTQWRAAFDGFLRIRRDSGELSYEVGTVNNDPTNIYVINEWDSAATYQKFLESPDLQNAMKSAGVTEAPHVLVLEKK